MVAARDENEIPELEDEDLSSDDIEREGQSQEAAQERQLDFDSYADQGRQPPPTASDEKVNSSQRTNDLGPLDSPAIDFAAYENPSKDIIDDYRNVIEDHGVQVGEIEAIARAFDSVR